MTRSIADNSSKSAGVKPANFNGGNLRGLDPQKLSAKDLPWLVERLREQSLLINKQKNELNNFYQQEKLKPDPNAAVDDSSPFGFLVLDHHGIILAVNQVVGDWLGLTKQEIVGKPLTIYIKQEDQVTFSWHRRLVLSTQAPQTCEFSLKRRGDGNKLYIRASSLLFAQKEEETPQWQMLLKKIVEQKKAPLERASESPWVRLVPELTKRLTIKTIADIDQQIDKIISIIGEITASDRCGLVFCDAKLTDYESVYEWCQEGLGPHLAKLKGRRLAAYPWLENKIRQWETVSIVDVNDLPQEAKLEKADLIVNDCQSILIVPMVFKKQLCGMIGLESVNARRIWTQEEKLVLMAVANMIIQAKERLAADYALKVAKEASRTLNSQLSTYQDKRDARERKYQEAKEALQKLKLKYQDLVKERHAVKDAPSKVPPIRIDGGLYNLLFKESCRQPESLGERPAIILHDEEKLPQFWQFKKGIPSVLMQVHEASADEAGNVKIKCPKCRLEKKVAYGIFKGHQYPIKVTCPCKHQFSVKLELRRSPRQKIVNRNMEGAYKDFTESNKWIKFSVVDISGTGMGFQVDGPHNLHEGQKLYIKYVNNDMMRTLIKKKVYVRTVREGYIGCEFFEPLSMDETIDVS